MLFISILKLGRKDSALIRLKIAEKFTKQTKKNQDIDLYSEEELGKKDSAIYRYESHEPKIRKEICYSSAQEESAVV
jgi:hypothetical protein